MIAAMPDTVPPPANEESTTLAADQADDDALGVPFARWAKVSSQLFRRSIAMRAALIHEAGLDENWTEVDNHWFRAIERDIEAGRRDRLEAYLELVAQERLRREEDGNPVTCPCEDFFPPDKHPAKPPQASTKPSVPDPPEADDKEADGEADEETDDSTPPPSSSGDREKDAAADAVSWPLEKYAWLCAELDHAPARADHVWSLHGLDTDDLRQVVQEAWGAKLAEDEDLAREHAKLVERYRMVLKGD